MTDKEKEAIQVLSLKSITSPFDAKDFPSCIVLKQDLHTVLNLIQEQQKEIEKKDKIIDEMAIALYDEWYMPSLNTVEKLKEYFINKAEKESKDE